MYIASADFMTRNTIRRVEVAAPIYDAKLRDYLREVFRIEMSDNVKARILGSDGNYTYVEHTEPAVNSQEMLYADAYRAVGSVIE